MALQIFGGGASTAALSTTFVRIKGALTTLGHMAPVGARTAFPQGLIGTVTEQQNRMRVYTVAGVKSVRLVYCNWYGGGTGAEVAGAADLLVAAGIEMPDGTFRKVYFGGAAARTISPGGTAISDPISIDHPGPADANPHFFVRTLVYAYTPGTTTPVAGAIPQGPTSIDGGEGTESGALTDKTTSGTVGSTFGFMYAPIVVGSLVNQGTVLAAVGDSIDYGNGDTPSYQGWTVRLGRDHGISVLKLTQGGRTSAGFITAMGHAKELPLSEGATHAICGHGANDLGTAAKTTPQTDAIKATLVAEWTLVKKYVPRVAARTITPRTTSTDAWATTANQTVTASEPARIAINDWLRDGAPLSAGVPVAIGTSGALRAGQAGHPLALVIDTADAIETARNSGIIKATGGAWTADGLHGNTRWYQPMADKVWTDAATWLASFATN